MHKNVIIIGGPTASGKSKLALSIAQKIPSVIINADSMQIYKELPIITAQPSTEEQEQIPHYLYGFYPAAQPFSVALWLDHVVPIIDRTLEEGKYPILVGGTGMYIKSLMQGIADIPPISDEVRNKVRSLLTEIGNEAFHHLLCEKDPMMGEQLSPGDSQRMVRAMEVLEETGISLHEWQQKPTKAHYPKDQFRLFFLHPPRASLYEQCNTRFITMTENGAIDEVRALAGLSLDPMLPAMKALGVPALLAYIKEDISLDDAIEQAQTQTRRYAKRQVTWFKNQFPEATSLDSNEPLESLVSTISQ